MNRCNKVIVFKKVYSSCCFIFVQEKKYRHMYRDAKGKVQRGKMAMQGLCIVIKIEKKMECYLKKKFKGEGNCNLCSIRGGKNTDT